MMNRPSTLLLLGAALGLPACVANHDLGQTASDGDSGDTGTEPTTSIDPSATSGQVPTATGGSDAFDDTGPMIPTATGMGEEEGTDGEPLCDEQGPWLTWEPADFSEPIAGVEIGNIAILAGDCTLDAVTTAGDATDIALDCVLSGRLDADADVTDRAFSPTIQIHSENPAETWLPDLSSGQLEVRMMANHWGMGWSRYLLLFLDGRPVLDLNDAEHVSPYDSGQWGEDLDELLQGEAWHSPFDVRREGPLCGGEVGECGELPQRLVVGWGATEGVGMHGGEGAVLPVPDTEGMFRGYASAVFNISPTQCTDMPLGDYRFAFWAVEP